jgi:hypothetical protein
VNHPTSRTLAYRVEQVPATVQVMGVQASGHASEVETGWSWLTVRDVNGAVVHQAIVRDSEAMGELAVAVERLTNYGHACRKVAEPPEHGP